MSDKMNYQAHGFFLVSIALLFGVVGCAEMSEMMEDVPQEPIPVATATGAAVGTGLGLLVGSQTGDALGGAAIGAVAGAGAGYAVGTVIEDREERASNQDEALRRQEQKLKAQRAELDELRGISGDSITYKDNKKVNRTRVGSVITRSSSDRYARASLGKRGKTYVDPATLKTPDLSSRRVSGGSLSVVTHQKTSPLREKTLSPPVVTASVNARPEAKIPTFASLGKSKAAPIEKKVVIKKKVVQKTVVQKTRAVTVEEPKVVSAGIAIEEPAILDAVEEPPVSVARVVDSSEGCKKAAQEIERGSSAESSADKLFYFRRALRLCPDAPEWHVQLGEVYGSLGRYDDAKFEYEEALRIKPGFKSAQTGLGSLSEKLY